MLASKISKVLSKSLVQNNRRSIFMLQRAALARPINFTPARYFAASDESNFDGHDDFSAKSKTSGSGLDKQINDWITENDICLFMKGTRKMPRCGFSNYTV